MTALDRPPVPRTVGAALDALSGAQKSAKGSPAYSRFVNRRMGRLVAAVAYRLGLTPDAVTVCSAVLTYGALVALALLPPGPLSAALICVGLVLGYAFDAADGQLARLRGGGSTSGEYLDHMLDAAKTVALHLLVAIAWFRHTDFEPAWLLLPLAFQGAAVVSFFAMLLMEKLRRTKRSAAQDAQHPPSVARSLAVLPTDYGLVCLSFALWGWQDAFRVVYAILFVATAGYVALGVVKWYLELRSQDREKASLSVT